MSPWMYQIVFPISLRICLRQVCWDRFGLNPWLCSLMWGSKSGSISCLITCCTSLSWKLGIPKGLCPPCGFGMYTLRVCPHWNLPCKTPACNVLSVFRDVPSIVSLVLPRVFEPGLAANVL